MWLFIISMKCPIVTSLLQICQFWRHWLVGEGLFVPFTCKSRCLKPAWITWIMHLQKLSWRRQFIRYCNYFNMTPPQYCCSREISKKKWGSCKYCRAIYVLTANNLSSSKLPQIKYWEMIISEKKLAIRQWKRNNHSVQS